MAAVVPADVVPTLLAFLLLLLGEGSWMAPAYSSSSSDAMALLSFKAAVKEDPGGLLSLWGRGEYAQYPCYWHGVACSNPNGSVVSLVLPNAGLVGPLRPLLSALSGLQKLLRLDLSGNSLFGNFSDYPPPSLPSLLRSLDLSRNGISGALPLGVFSNLQDLNLSANALSGGIPPQLFPAAVGLNLQVLDLSQNNLTGTIPSTIAACAHLSLLNLASNRLSGVLPEDFVGSLVSLESLYLGNNSFMGSLPGLPGGNSSLGLKILDLSSNRISGTISPQICVSLPLLERLLLQNNELSGGLPAALANCTELRALGLSFNSLTGPLPPEWSELSKLESLSAWNSGLTGEIPPQYGKLGQLRNLILNDNKLSGTIPAELGNCTRMEWLSLSSNQLTGEIPEVGDAVTVLQLGGNLLSGELPPGLGNCTHLLWLDASGNELTGAISPHLFNGSWHALNKTTLGGDTFAFARNMADGVCHGIGSLLDFSGMTTAALWSVPSLHPCAPTVRLYLGTTLSSNPDFSSIQYLDLSRNRLHGSIPTELGNAQALQILDLSHNSLYGTIPASFALLRNLGVLDLSNNELEGSIWPLANCTFLVQINLSDNFFSGVIPQTGQLATASASAYANNPALCGEPLLACGAAAATSRSSGNSPSRSCRFSVLSRATVIILSVLVSLVLLCLAAIALALLAGARKRKRQKTLLGSIHSSFDGSHSSWNLSAEKEPLSINVATFERPLVRKLTFSHLVEATDGFSRGSLIGRGGFGEVYRARLKDDGALVAIKKLVQCACQGDREFMAEMETLGKIKHRNLVPLLGYCKVGEERLLVYEFMEGGSLDEVLHTGSREHLTWERRKRIAKGAARGLAFLHHNCIPHIIHRDMKSSNVLLDKDMEARVSDFGMARLINALDTHLSVSTLAGTPGYVPPEYYQSFRCTAKGDVYSFGVVLLELLTGRRPTDKEGAPEFDDNCNLVGWVKLHVTQKREMDVLDPVLLREKGGDDEGGSSTPAVEQEMLHYLRIACSCLEDLPFKRPSILQVVAMFKDLDNFDMPASQATSCSSSSSSSLSSQPNLAQRVLNHFSFSSSENPKGDIEDLLSNNRGGTT